ERNGSGGGDAYNGGCVLRETRGVFLAVGIADLRRRLHDVSGLGAVDTGGPPGGVVARRQVRGELAEVPDGPLIVLRVPVESLLGEGAGQVDAIPHLDCPRAVDDRRVVRDVHGVDLGLLLEIAGVRVEVARSQWKEPIVDGRRTVE